MMIIKNITKMKFSFILILIMVISITGFNINISSAETTTQNVVYISGTGNDNNSGETPLSPVATLKKAYEKLSADGGTIYVVNKVYLENNAEIDKSYYKNEEGTVDVNGEINIKRYVTPTNPTSDSFNAESNPGYMLIVNIGDTVTLKNIVIDGHAEPTTTGSTNEITEGAKANYPALYVNENGKLILDGTTVQNCAIKDDVNTTSAVSIAGVLEINDCLIKNNQSNNIGTISVGKTGSAIMRGGTITQNIVHGTLTSSGAGAIRNYGTFEMTGGEISYNKAGRGGAFWCGWSSSDSATVTNIKGGSINNNYATVNGGAIYVDQNANNILNITNGTQIIGNTADNKGGALYSYGTVTIDDAIIKGNKALNGGGLYQNGQGSLTLKKATVTENTATSKGEGIFVNGVFYITAETKVDTNNDIYLNDPRYITVLEKLTCEGLAGRITPSVYTAKRYLAFADYDNGTGSELMEKFILTPKDGYYMKAGDTFDAAANISGNAILVGEEYTFTFDQNTDASVQNLPESQIKRYKEAMVLTEEIPERAGYVFIGWNTSPDGTGTSYAAGQNIDLNTNGNITLYAQWEKGGGYVDGKSGDDKNPGNNAASPLKTLKQAYINLQETGGTIYVLGTINISDDVLITETGYKDPNTEINIADGKTVTIKRYSKPTSSVEGFETESFTKELINIAADGKLTLENIVIDGHKDAFSNDNIEQTASEVISIRPLIVNLGSFVMNDGAYIQNNNNQQTGNQSGTTAAGINNRGTMVMNGGYITNNIHLPNGSGEASPAHDGGGISNTGNLTIYGGEVSNNECRFYGAGIISCYNNASLYVGENAKILNNTSGLAGGGISVTAGSFTFAGGTISGNSTKTYGGGIHTETGVSWNMSNGTIENNNAETYGGGVFNGGTMNMYSGTIIGNQCAYKGGGIENDGTLNMFGGTIKGNSASTGGGGVLNRTAMVMTGGTIEENTSGNNGAGIFNNYATSDITINKGTIKGNNSVGSGGGLYNNEGTVTISSKEVIFTENKSPSSYGGAISSSGVVDIADCNMTKNTALYGGAVHNTGTLNIENCLITENIAKSINVGTDDPTYSSGGGIYSSGTMNITAGEISSNISNLGGGIYTNSSATTQIDKGTLITKNKAINEYDTNGDRVSAGVGAGFRAGGTVEILGGNITYNESEYDAGGLIIYGDTTISDVYIAYNSCTSNGGGIFASKNMTMHEGIIEHNTANQGGGIYASAPSTAHLKGGLVNNNTSIGSGGGVWTSNYLYIYDGFVISNNTSGGTGGGITTSVNGKVTLYGGLITQNTAAKSGGGVHFCGYKEQYSGFMLMEGGTITDNKATGAGGGISVTTKAEFTLTGGTISNNISQNGGGGIFIGGNMIMSGGNITDNEAIVAGGGIAVNTGAAIDLTGGEISNNTTPSKGSGVALRGILNMSNNAAIDLNNDVYLYEGCKITVTDELTSTEDKVAIITPHEYYPGRLCASADYIAANADDIVNKFLLTEKQPYKLESGTKLPGNENITANDVFLDVAPIDFTVTEKIVFSRDATSIDLTANDLEITNNADYEIILENINYNTNQSWELVPAETNFTSMPADNKKYILKHQILLI